MSTCFLISRPICIEQYASDIKVKNIPLCARIKSGLEPSLNNLIIIIIRTIERPSYHNGFEAFLKENSYLPARSSQDFHLMFFFINFAIIGAGIIRKLSASKGFSNCINFLLLIHTEYVLTKYFKTN